MVPSNLHQKNRKPMKATDYARQVSKDLSKLAFDSQFQAALKKKFGNARTALHVLGMDQWAEQYSRFHPPDSIASMTHEAGDTFGIQKVRAKGRTRRRTRASWTSRPSTTI